jgi:hypothetical protein
VLHVNDTSSERDAGSGNILAMGEADGTLRADDDNGPLCTDGHRDVLSGDNDATILIIGIIDIDNSVSGADVLVVISGSGGANLGVEALGASSDNSILGAGNLGTGCGSSMGHR